MESQSEMVSPSSTVKANRFSEEDCERDIRLAFTLPIPTST